MAEVFKMPRLGESVTEGTVTAWLKEVGDRVEMDDPLFEVSTDKVDSEIPSPFEGVILEILVPEGETVDVDTPLVRIGEESEANGDGDQADDSEESAEDGSGPKASKSTGKSKPASSTQPAGKNGKPEAVSARKPGADGGGSGRTMLSPIVRRLAAEHSIDLDEVTGSGEGGRIMREDIEAFVAEGRPAAEEVPAARADEAAEPEEAQVPAPAAASEAEGDGRTEVVRLTRIRTLIAENMSRSLQISPHVWTSIEVDLERIEQVRQKHKGRFRAEEGAGLTYMVFQARALCDALRRFPLLNSSVDMEAKTTTLHHYVNLGFAVDLDGEGLVVPVIKDADSLNLRGLARAISSKAKAARDKKLPADEMSGSTFTITNPGPMGDYASAPIINQPNVAILSTNQVARRPTVVGDFVGIHHMTILGLSYDHRGLDGVTASKFLVYLRDALQDRDWESELQ